MSGSAAAPDAFLKQKNKESYFTKLHSSHKNLPKTAIELF